MVQDLGEESWIQAAHNFLLYIYIKQIGKTSFLPSNVFRFDKAFFPFLYVYGLAYIFCMYMLYLIEFSLRRST